MLCLGWFGGAGYLVCDVVVLLVCLVGGVF